MKERVDKKMTCIVPNGQVGKGPYIFRYYVLTNTFEKELDNQGSDT